MPEWEEVLPPETAARPRDNTVGVAGFACAAASVVLALIDPVLSFFSVPLAVAAAACGVAGGRRAAAGAPYGDLSMAALVLAAVSLGVTALRVLVAVWT
jgi:hypothetical protein